MSSPDLLIDTFGRVKGVVHRVVDGLTPEQLSFRLDEEANSIAWLVWHLSRIQDDHVADAAGSEQVYTSDGGPIVWHCRSMRRPPATDTHRMRSPRCELTPVSC